MDLTSIQTINYIRNKYGFHMRKGLGQNFLQDAAALDNIIQAASLSPDSGTLEIGPGIGVLTARLAEASKKTVTIEIDTNLLEVLDETLAPYENIKIINADVMKVDLAALIAEEFSDCASVSIAANLPYYITTPILTRLLEDPALHVKDIVVMVQKEVAQRLCARPKAKSYSALSVLVAYHSVPEIVTVVPASSFVPPPKVDSAVVKLAMRTTPPIQPLSEKAFFKTVRAAFGQRRKTLINALCGSNLYSLSKEEMKTLITSLGFPETVRGEELGLQEFCVLSDALINSFK